jgi:hypothetical protein
MRFGSRLIVRRTGSILPIFNKTKDVNPVSNIAAPAVAADLGGAVPGCLLESGIAAR